MRILSSINNKKLFTTIYIFDIIDKSQRQAGVAQSVAHLIGSEEVTGSIPVASFLIEKPGILEYDRIPGFLCFLTQLLFCGLQIKAFHLFADSLNGIINGF